MKQTAFSVLTILLVLLISVCPSFAEIKLPAVFCDNMVLQQQTEVAIWGKANKNSSVKVSTSWNSKSYSSKASADGSWKLKVATPNAGGPYEITISDGKALKLKNVLIGEVWICSGQSNMEFQVKGFKNKPIAGSSYAVAISTN